VFKTILIANRGEIACRVIKTARRLGVRTIAVYSEADAGALHVALADEAYLIGPAPAAESYLCIGAILDAARASEAEAVHPGYGFLSESAKFAAAVAAAELTFVGPPVEAIRAMGSKSEAKTLMEKAGVPLVPGYHGAAQQPKRLARAASEIGFPVLIKASAGGGGKGMRVVESEAEFAAALDSAKREAMSAFGDDRVLLEKYLTRPRHVEVQVFCDTEGRAVQLFERDCSLQRRHQKVVEEAPAPGITAVRRAEMGEVALAAAKAIGYVGAGTVEFIAEGDAFYFMEMNTRIQVEHPVTEMITGLDLVEWQLRVAAGEPLPMEQNSLALSGHAFEARIYAEDPERDFLPATGRLLHLRLPAADAHVRVDSGVIEGDIITPHYDPMIAKLVVWDHSRDDALRRLNNALADTEIAGVTTNLAFLSAVARHPDFAAGNVDTGFIARHRDAFLASTTPVSDEVLAIACLAEILHRGEEAKDLAAHSSDPFSPWNQNSGWRLNTGTHSEMAFLDGDREVSAILRYRPSGYQLELPGGTLQATCEAGADGEVLVVLDGMRQSARVVRHGKELTVITRDGSHHLKLRDPLDLGGADVDFDRRVVAPMPGRVVKLLVGAGDKVKRGAPLILLEAMKMEHTLAAPSDGTVKDVFYAVGDLVEDGAELFDFEAKEGRPP
jgi:3-methylcrotonyl-CoA carboxylase alpha subunit